MKSPQYIYIFVYKYKIDYRVHYIVLCYNKLYFFVCFRFIGGGRGQKRKKDALSIFVCGDGDNNNGIVYGLLRRGRNLNLPHLELLVNISHIDIISYINITKYKELKEVILP